jgi:hypothetical protein
VDVCKSWKSLILARISQWNDGTSSTKARNVTSNVAMDLSPFEEELPRDSSSEHV